MVDEKNNERKHEVMKMGWSHFIIIHDWKMKIEISRHFEEDKEISEKFKELDNSVEILRNEETLVKDAKRITVGDLSNILNCVKITESIDLEYFSASALLIFLKDKNIKFEIISENDQEFKKYNEYKDVRFNYD